jgi:hypothetical protein
MTMALCFNCGHTKFGAICPCPECTVASTGDMNLDIAFSDHRMSVATIEAFGKVIRALRPVCADDQLRFWSFIRFVSVNYSDVLGVEMPPEREAACDAVLARANPPPVVVEESERARYMRELEQRGGPEGPGAAPPPVA